MLHKVQMGRPRLSAEKRTITMGVRLPVSLWKLLEKLAAEENRTRTNMIHVLLEEALEKRGKRP